jgi:DNA-binding NtrC family response regulator
MQANAQTMSVDTFKVMVVDDVAAARQTTVSLRAKGFTAESGGSAEEALDAIRQREFDLVLSLRAHGAELLREPIQAQGDVKTARKSGTQHAMGRLYGNTVAS